MRVASNVTQIMKQTPPGIRYANKDFKQIKQKCHIVDSHSYPRHKSFTRKSTLIPCFSSDSRLICAEDFLFFSSVLFLGGRVGPDLRSVRQQLCCRAGTVRLGSAQPCAHPADPEWSLHQQHKATRIGWAQQGRE